MTFFDILDAAVIAVLITAAFASRAPFRYGLCISTLIVHQCGARVLIGLSAHPVLPIALLDLCIGISYLFFPATKYGLAIALSFVAMALVSAVAVFAGFNLDQDQGLRFDYWNLISTMGHVIAVLIFAGIWKQRNGEFSGGIHH